MTDQSIPVTIKMSDDYWHGYLDAIRHADEGLMRIGADDIIRSVVCVLNLLPYQHGYEPDWARCTEDKWRN